MDFYSVAIVPCFLFHSDGMQKRNIKKDMTYLIRPPANVVDSILLVDWEKIYFESVSNLKTYYKINVSVYIVVLPFRFE